MSELIPRHEAMALFRHATRQVQTLLDTMPVPADTRIPHMDWTVGDLAAHLVQGAQIAGDLADGKASPFERFDRIAETNEKLLEEKPERDIAMLAREYRAAIASLDSKFAKLPDDARVPFHQGWTFSVPESLVMASTEHLMHAWDLASVTPRPLQIDPAHARLMLYVVAQILPNVVNEDAARGFTATYELRIRGGKSFRLHFEGGDLFVSVVEPGGPADCRISVDPVAFLLSGYGRGSQIKTMLTGRIVAWGRKPWLAGKFTSLVRNP